MKKLSTGVVNKLLDKLMFHLLERYAPRSYEGINEDKRSEWLLALTLSEGFRHYFVYRDLQLMKSMASGVDREIYIKLVGHRAELLYLIGESKRIHDLYERSKKDRSGTKGDNEDV